VPFASRLDFLPTSWSTLVYLVYCSAQPSPSVMLNCPRDAQILSTGRQGSGLSQPSSIANTKICTVQNCARCICHSSYAQLACVASHSCPVSQNSPCLTSVAYRRSPNRTSRTKGVTMPSFCNDCRSTASVTHSRTHKPHRIRWVKAQVNVMQCVGTPCKLLKPICTPINAG
jgi:hypothetical protein